MRFRSSRRSSTTSYAGATAVTIEVTIGAPQLLVTVSDEGRGFGTSTAAVRAGIAKHAVPVWEPGRLA
jgi:anti-sigma regulatory factor (Ser/Thr protein kinase)